MLFYCYKMIGILSVLVCVMAVGYALLAQELTINGRASIDSTWKVEITNIASKDVVGDTIEFAGSNWKVIKNSTNDEDYVTLMKETVLTNSELGKYANGVTDTMYFHENCNVYATSKVKEMLETSYLPTIGANNLKEVDGYKIRLITTDELTSNLG